MSPVDPKTRQERPGEYIGRYKLLEKIGEGGCGVVYMAEQFEPVHRRVALKIIKPGMDSEEVIARFEAERQALALMEHPSIAKVFDGGATDSGRPYFVMELVRGVRITDYCDQHKLPMRQRLDLFMQVCKAVQHAHQKGIIHRDIKPSNILVTIDGGIPLPKVIDFGIAKATGQRLTDKTLFTRLQQLIGTPSYMSPEQAEMTSLDVDTRSDIYSLGVLLYELLTAHTPFDARELLRSGMVEMLRTIREREPVRPSACLRTLTDPEQTTVAERRRTEAPKLINSLRGDLDWIVMKCLEKDRNRRYETASSLAADIKRHMEDEPVIARPPTQLYRLGRMIRRNKAGFAAATAAAMSLFAGCAIATNFYFRERAARKRADERAAVIQTVGEFLTSNLLDAPFADMTGLSFTPEAGDSPLEGLARAASKIGDKFKDQPLVEAKLRQAIGDAYSSFDVKQPTLAIPQYERALKLRQMISGPNDPATLHTMKAFAMALKDAGRIAEAITLNTEALRLIRQKYGSESDECTVFIYLLAESYREIGQIAAAIPLLRELVALTSKTNQYPALEVLYRGKLAALYEQQNDFETAESVFRESVSRTEQNTGPNEIQTALALRELGAFLLRRQKFQDAESALRRCLRIHEEKHPNRWVTFNTESMLGGSLLGQKKLSDAEPLLLNGYHGIKRLEDEIPKDRKHHLGKALERLVELYTVSEKPNEAAEWKARLEEFNRMHVETNAPAGKTQP